MVRGTFANIRLKNRWCPAVEGGVTRPRPLGRADDIYDAAEKLPDGGHAAGGGRGQGVRHAAPRATGRRRGTLLLGVRAVIAESYERIHRRNLVGMGVLPLQFKAGQNRESLGLTGDETFEIGAKASTTSSSRARRSASRPPRPTARRSSFSAIARIDTPVEVEYYRNGGILQTVLRRLLKAK